MPVDQDVNGASDTIVVKGDYSEDSAEGSDDSFDAYGGDGEGEDVEEEMQDAPDPANEVNDDYAKTFESPPANEHQGDAAQSQPEEADVSMASESMNNSSAPDPLKSGSPSASTPVLPSLPSTATPQPANGATHSSSDSSGGDGNQSTPSPHPSASASKSPTSAPLGHPSTASPVVAALEATVGIDNSAEAPASASPPESRAGEINIEKLVDDITAGAAIPPKPHPSAPEPAAALPASTPSLAMSQPLPIPTPNVVLSTLTVSPSASLPPKPAVSHHLSNHSFQSRAPQSHQSHANQRGSYMSSGPPGVASERLPALPPPPSSYGGPHAPPHGLPSAAHPGAHGPWETFLADEKRYTSEGNWERFPEGSRIFIGNLSSERISKREVYDIFSKFGRLAQISLKNAYGFVQYHTIEEGNEAMQNAQGIEMAGRKIHLEISRTQKKTDKGDRDRDRERSPERRVPRGERGTRPNERFEGRDPNGRRDDYRSGRSPSPRRHDYRGGRDGFGPRDREYAGAERRRSRSPQRYGRSGPESYRTRSPTDELADLPRRHGSDVPDVQFFANLSHDGFRNYVDWLQKAFRDRGLRTDVMFVRPNFPRDAMIQRQIVEGVHAIVEIDPATFSTSTGEIGIRVFKRPRGTTQVQFDDYVQLTPSVAAEVVLRAKAESAMAAAMAAPAPMPAPVYHPTYANAQYAPNPQHAGYGYPYSQAPAAPPVAAPPPVQMAGYPAAAIGQLDNNALQALLASLPSLQANAAAAPLGAPVDAGHQAQQVDINALMGNLRNAAANQAAPMPSYSAPSNYGAAPMYPQQQQHGGHAIAPANGTAGYDTTAQQVQSIMEQLKRASN
ncbi:hypothetical protein QBC39DRAFT_307466 [Podospora conica]|nr:hypothetical protein QBC39DRAFT_307466 [Schizothecium conicum]